MKKPLLEFPSTYPNWSPEMAKDIRLPTKEETLAAWAASLEDCNRVGSTPDIFVGTREWKEEVGAALARSNEQKLREDVMYTSQEAWDLYASIGGKKP